MNIDYLPIIVGAIGLVAAFVVYRVVLSYPAGEGKVVEIAEKIHTGAMTFMRREYIILWGIAIVIIVAIGLSSHNTIHINIEQPWRHYPPLP